MSIFKKDEETETVKKSEKELGLEALSRLKASKIVIEKDESLQVDNALLKELGFTKMSNTLERVASVRAKENMAAVSGYTRISRKTYDAINKELRDATRVTIDRSGGRAYLEICATAVGEYDGVPPADILKEMQNAKKASIFDSFAILHLSKRSIPDPILVGMIEGSRDFYAIGEWGGGRQARRL